MSARRRLALLFVGLPVAFYAYACSSDSGGGEQGTDAGSEETTNPDEDTSTPGTDSSTPVTDDGSTPVTDGSTGIDASDGAVAPTCVGNPLTADGGTVDGGANLDAATAANLLSVAAGTFIDGPQWIDTDAGGYLAYSEFDKNERVLRVTADGGDAGGVFRTAPLGDGLGPTGNAVRNGFLLTLASDKNGDTGALILQTALDGSAGPSIAIGPNALSPNDLVVGKGGHIYFTDPRYQANGGVPTGVFATASDGGGAARFASFTGGEKPNGIALSPDGSKLYVSFTEPKRVDSYPVAANGTVTATATTVIAGVKLTDAPDGIAVDVAGNLYVAEADADGFTANGRVEVFKPNGDRWGEIPLPGTRPTALAFGGTDKTLLFITYETGIRVYRGRCAGLPEN